MDRRAPQGDANPCTWSASDRKSRRRLDLRRPVCRTATLAASLALSLVVAATIGLGCAGKAPKRAVRPTLPPIDAPDALRGTVATQADLNGVQPTLVSGIGFVVGLAGTGGLPLDDRVASTLERQLGLVGLGEPKVWEGTAFEGMTPRQAMQDPNTAAVIITAAVPPGSPEGARFDVMVRAMNATSLEGGKLWTTELRIGPPATFGAQTARKLGEAHGDIFINPFADVSSELAAVGETTGRILGGGVVTDGLEVELRLRTPSHARTRLLTSTINSRFPRRAGDREPIARGLDEASIAIRVPRRYQDKAGEFIQLLRYMQTDSSFPHIHAKRYIDAVQREPYLAGDLSWALQALGEAALPFIRELYDHPEEAPRLAGLRAGAGLGDAIAAPSLKDLALNGSDAVRPDAIRLLGELDAGPTVDLALRSFLDEEELTIRIAAYEALASRAERAQRSRLLRSQNQQTLSKSQRMTIDQLDLISVRSLPMGTIQGVARTPIEGKFFLDRVPFGEPMIYITQQGTPRVVVFGEQATLRQPLFVSAWGDRLLMVNESPGEPIRVRYETRPLDDPRLTSGEQSRVYRQSVEPSIVKLIDLLSNEPKAESPDPGFDMTYAEVVGALHAVWRAGGMEAAFATERDRLAAELLAAADSEPITVRPETADDVREVVVLNDPLRRRTGTGRDEPRLGPDGKPTLVVPLEQPSASDEDDEETR